jgi:homoserine dehydrogenase
LLKLILAGFGVVGQGFTEILRDKAATLQQNMGFEAQIVGVATRTRGTLYHPDGLDLDQLLTTIETGHLDHYPDSTGLARNQNVLTLIREGNADILLESTYTDLKTGQPALDFCRAALDTGKHLVLANKGPVALAYDELSAKAAEMGRLLLYEATVMAGTPTLRLGMQALAGCRIHEARGILNGTTNYILSEMEGGMAYADALSQAQRLGYAEADPTADVDGWDAAAKVLILSPALFGKTVSLDDLKVRGISHITPEMIEEATKAGERWKLIAKITPTEGSVVPTRIPINHPLASVGGATNAITYVTDLLGEVTLVGPGAGRLQTGFALLADLLEIHRMGQR